MKRPLLLLALLVLLCMRVQARPRLHIVTESSPPSAMMGEHGITGFATDKIRMMLERAGVDYDIDMVPWKRAYLTAQTRGDTCVYSTTRVPEREALFKWVGPTHENDWTLFGRADRNYYITTIEDARRYRIGAYNSDVRSEALIAQGFIVDTVQDKLSNPRKLLVNRIDLWASSMRVGSSIVAENGWTGKIVPVLTFRRTDLYLACNRSVPDVLIIRMNAALRAMNSEGISAAIERRYNYSNAPARR
ncbi:ABC transporter substrate-binding protein [Massilia sp. PAMC28688]|uniref:substrate-binding periplasmic protein n=1 Tax=Massilia sp. PAMC28688 TaxID=2861283 RepID=UPI001C639ACF|nr:ABC transporter substrate-binding protein [Massilia sp. PAMC28688]QYF94725.1 ABC transporter substrate-binding protein [Massilia sp. PAMC28688]